MGNLIRCQNGHMFSARRYGTICPYCNIETATREKKETGQTEISVEEALFLQEEKPVCGWLVCVEGPRRGKDYKVMEGKNFVGRADDMDIQILGDNKISRRNHCVIVYDEKLLEEAVDKLAMFDPQQMREPEDAQLCLQGIAMDLPI